MTLRIRPGQKVQLEFGVQEEMETAYFEAGEARDASTASNRLQQLDEEHLTVEAREETAVTKPVVLSTEDSPSWRARLSRGQLRNQVGAEVTDFKRPRPRWRRYNSTHRLKSRPQSCMSRLEWMMPKPSSSGQQAFF